MNPALSIVIPVYNEGDNIRATLAEVHRCITLPHEILIVYDFEEDNTLPVLRSLLAESAAETRHLRLVRNTLGPGVLHAIKTGFTHASAPAVLVVMADLSDDLARVPAMYEKFRAGADIVCASRYMPGGKQIGGPRFKKFLSRLAGVSLHYLVGLGTHDVTNSFKLYRKTVIDETVIESNGGFELGMEIVVKAFLRGRQIAEVPATWRDRTAGESRFRLWHWLPRYLRWYVCALKGRLLHRPCSSS